MLTLTLRTPPTVPLELDGLIPDRIISLSSIEVARLPVYHGNRKEELGAFFSVGGTGADAEVRIRGDCSHVKSVGAGMTAGRIVVEGGVGTHAGAGMGGGELVVHERSGDWLGAEMRGGLIRVVGDAGDQVGAAYRGSRQGMTGGTILVAGNAGIEVGALMRRGLVAVGGTAGPFAAAGMIAGTLIALAGLGRAAGTGMKRGTLLAGGPMPETGPGFRFSCDYRPAFARVLFARLRALRFEPAAHQAPTTVRCFRGDAAVGGRGELLLL